MAGAAETLAVIEAAFANPDAVARDLLKAGRRVIRTIGSDAPLTFLRAAGFVTTRVIAKEKATPKADALIGAAARATRAHRLLEWLLAPEWIDVPILITRADADQPQLFAALRELARLGDPAPRNVAMLDLLHQPRESSRRYNERRLEQLGEWLERVGGARVDEAAIAEAADQEAHLAKLLRAADELRSAGMPLLSGTQMLRVAGAAEILPVETAIGLLEALLADSRSLRPLKGERLWWVGSAPEDAAVYASIERENAVIVGETHDWGAAQVSVTPPFDLRQVADPSRRAPLPSRRVSEVAGAARRDAVACGADAFLHVVLDGDEVAPWLLHPLKSGPGDVPTRSLRLPKPVQEMPPVARSAKPSPPSRSRKLLRAAEDFGTYQREWFAEVRARVADGEPFAIVNANAPQEILRALGIPFVVNQWWASIVAAKRQSGRYLKLLADQNYPTDGDAYSAQAVAAAFDREVDQAPWGGLPSPGFVHAIASSDTAPAIFEALAQANDASCYIYERTIDPRAEIETRWWDVMPDGWDEALEPERLDLMVEELREVVAKLEHATGRTFDAERFQKVLDLVNEQEESYRATRDLIARTVPAPISIVDSMPATMVPQWHRGSVWARDAARSFHEEVAERVAAGKGVVPDEKVRLMWVGRGLWSDTAFYQKWEESHGAVFVWSMYLALAADGYIRHYDRGRDPLRSLAARFLTMGDELRMPSWAGPWHVHEAQTHQVDGAVALSDADPFVIRALKAAGVPLLELGVDNFAFEPEDASRLDDRITAFIEGPAGIAARKRRAAL